MRKFLAALAIAGVAVLAACGGPAKPVVGTVTARQFVPQHQQEAIGIIGWMPQTVMTEQCTTVGRLEECEPYAQTRMQPLYGPVEETVPNRWYLTVDQLTGKSKKVSVSESVYDAELVGQHYDSRINK